MAEEFGKEIWYLVILKEFSVPSKNVTEHFLTNKEQAQTGDVNRTDDGLSGLDSTSSQH